MTVELSRRETNVLRRLLNRAEFRPKDVARLGLGRLESAQGLGVKGLANVLTWLSVQGYDLRPQVMSEVRNSVRLDRLNRRLEQAQYLLEQLGWQVSRPEHDHENHE